MSNKSTKSKETPKTQKSDKEIASGKEYKWYVISAVMLLFLIFLLLKINGYFDYTSRYGIEWIIGDEGYNCLMILDKDEKTTWGLLNNFQTNSSLVMKFKDNRSISKVRIINASDEETVPMSIFVSDDGQNYLPCQSTVDFNGNMTEYTLDAGVSGIYMAFVYGGVAGGHWPITEVEIDE